MKRIMISNPNVYTMPELVSDSDSDTDLEYVFRTNIASTQAFSSKANKNAIEYGCVQDPSMIYQNTSFRKTGKTYDEQSMRKKLEHKLKIKQENALYKKQQREKREAEFKAAQTYFKDEENEFNDEDFLAKLKKQEQRAEARIAEDKKRFADQTAQEKARLEKEQKEKEKELQEKERKKKALQEKKDEIAKAQSNATCPAGLAEYEKYFAKIEHYKTNVRPLLEKDDFRKKCFPLKREIRRTVAQITSQHEIVLQKYKFLYDRLMSVKKESYEAFEVMLNSLAKIFLGQVKQEIHTLHNAGYHLARFAYLMCSTVPEFLDYLMGRLIKRCQYLIPRYHDDDPNLSPDEMRARLRYIYQDKETKTMQDFLEHAETQACYVLFYGALCQTLPDPGQPENPFPIKHGWIWLSRICNMPPREVTPVLVAGFLEVAAKRLLEAYPNQTPKLFRLIRYTILDRYIIADNNVNKSHISRIKSQLDGYFKTGQVECLPEIAVLRREEY